MSAADKTPAAAFCLLAIKAIPNAPRSEVVGWLGDAIKIKVHAPPVEGRANEVLCAFLADALNLPQRAVTVLRGDTSRQKTIRIHGLSLAEVTQRLGLAPRGS
ncbi:DUF167 domain-containing protein [Horticoccus sp. 23ND18S-11]|uniref:DUF167 domain-containing protein n=1 Tax=Horticoccus sp. 23ND18S-11 TaxID=3391832 RepID=UPI0039C9F4F5